MYVILLALGLAAAAGGAGLIALNLPVDMVRLAYTLLIVGAIGLVGGLILMGVAAANRQLRRIVQLLDARPPPRAPEAPTSGEPTVGLPAPTAPSPEPVSAPSDPVPAPVLRAEPDPAFHPEVPDPAAEPVPSPASSKPESSAFDAMWASAARDARERRQVQEPEQRGPYVGRAAAGTKSTAGGGATVTVFKSGVIDGMAYTLYTDGSIEAEMPGGTVHFATVDDLRAYLDEHA